MTIVEKIKNGVELSDKEIESIYHEKYKELSIIEEVVDPDHDRWSTNVDIIFGVEDKLYSVYFDRGLTESQPDWFYKQVAVEVYKKAITSYIYVKVEEESQQ